MDPDGCLLASEQLFRLDSSMARREVWRKLLKGLVEKGTEGRDRPRVVENVEVNPQGR